MASNNINIRIMNQLPETDVYLYRYFSIDKLLDFLANGRIAFSRLDLFEDRLEGTTLYHLLVNLGAEKISKDISPILGDMARFVALNVEPKKRNSLRRKREIFQTTNYASCWYMNNHESVAMWKLYSGQDSVALRIPLKRLTDVIVNQDFEINSGLAKSITLGRLKYFRFDDLDELSNSIVNDDEQGFIKDKSFEHEKEFRFVIGIEQEEQSKAKRNDVILDEQVERMNRERNLKIIHLELKSFSTLPFEIIFHPQSQNWHRTNVEKIVAKLGLPFKVYESKLKQIFE